MSQASLLEKTLSAAIRDMPSVDPGSRPLARLPDGMREQRKPLHMDERGELTEILSRHHGFDDHPIEDAYLWTVRPGFVKGWALHKLHEDRYFLVTGEAMLVLYDVRPESSTCGQVFTVPMTERDRRLISIPANVWHADANFGTCDAICLNFPTRAYDAENPDKYRLPIDTPLIPYDFSGMRGW